MAPIIEEPRLSEDIQLGAVGDGFDEAVLTGLGPLKSQNRLIIKQKLQTCEILTGCEQENRFTVAGEQGETLYWAKEHSGCCDR